MAQAIESMATLASKFTEVISRKRASNPRNKAKNKPKFPINYRRSNGVYFNIVN